ncbi:O-antigen ligase family protein [Heliorestis convoluta]|uniref:O-antigen ligase membrane family protein n=1 Tax=Heliorestis convoluta TaxID=356322 RepID=A0A5Q2N0C8_9FIRM|nr:O-antigen ligase family protein [Heliorestis convoluta]QGG47193.1 O-antigen ligase membrane family protein [Heliorestis convoluta]
MSKNKQKDNKQHHYISTFDLFPLLIVIALVPLIVYMNPIELEGIVKYYWPSEVNNDFFSYNKAIILMMATATAFFFFAIRFFLKNIEFKPMQIYIPLGIYALFIILSTLLAEHKSVAMLGFPDRYEGALVLLSYLLITFITLNIVKEEKHFKILIGGLFLSASIIGVIGVFQFFGMDFFKSDLGKQFMVPAAYSDIASTLNFTFGPYTIYATLYNTNYVGSYAVLVLPLAMMLFYSLRQQLPMVASFLLTCLIFATLFGSNSRAGMMGLLIAFILLAILFHREMRTQWKKTAALFTSFALILFVLNTASDGRTLGRLGNMTPAAQPVLMQSGESEFAVNQEAASEQASDSNSLTLLDIVMERNRIALLFDQDTLTFANEEGILQIVNQAGEALDYDYDEEKELIVFTDSRYDGYAFMLADNRLKIDLPRGFLVFEATEDGFMLFGPGGKLHDQIVLSEGISLFEGRERWGSGRGYIWSRSVPMLKDTLLLGYGPDTYAIYFPQEDLISKLNYMSNAYTIVDKPHNLYLQTAINTGLPSLFAMLAMFGMYGYSSLRLYGRSRFDSFYARTGLAIFIAIMGYLVAGFFNDSLVSVAPVFWVLFGLGLACNYLYEKEEEST